MKFLAPAIVAAGVIAATGASAADRCRVTDPTGTPLNVRAAPQGRVTGQAANGMLVQMIETGEDRGGKTWARIARQDGRPMGWVFREFVSCF